MSQLEQNLPSHLRRLVREHGITSSIVKHGTAGLVFVRGKEREYDVECIEHIEKWFKELARIWSGMVKVTISWPSNEFFDVCFEEL